MSAAKDTCDKYFGQLVRARGMCERCGGPGPYEAAHIIRRRFVGDPDGIPLRHNEDNAWCLCRSCHREVDNNAIEFTRLVERTIGIDKWVELTQVKNARHRPWREKDWIRERARLRALLNEEAA